MCNFYVNMQKRSFVPKLKQLEQLQLELDNEEENLKIKNGLLLNKPLVSAAGEPGSLRLYQRHNNEQ